MGFAITETPVKDHQLVYKLARSIIIMQAIGTEGVQGETRLGGLVDPLGNVQKI